jgi:membrane fusion protein (multidrug efflux system)
LSSAAAFGNAGFSVFPQRRLAARAAVFVATAALLAACGGNPEGGAKGPGGMPPPEVTVVTLQPKDVGIGFEYVGQTAGSRETEVRARVAGILQERLFEEGTRVPAGAPLFQIDPAPFQTQLNSAEAVVAVSEARVNQTKRELARLEPLAAEKAISQKEYDDAKSAFETAEATLKQSRAQAAEARLNLGYTRVVAPIGGITSIASKANGSLVTAADSLLTTLVQTDLMYVYFSIPESDFLKLSKDIASGKIDLAGKNAKGLGLDVGLRMSDGSNAAKVGRVTYVAEKINPANGGFDARAEVPNTDGKLRPGQFVRVTLQGAKRTNTIAVPQRAVIDSPMGKIVFTVTPDNKLAPRPVELDGWTNGEWIVTKGLAGGERVLVDGFIKAHDPGMTVTPVPLGAASAPAAGAPVGGAPAKSAPAAASGAKQ